MIDVNKHSGDEDIPDEPKENTDSFIVFEPSDGCKNETTISAATTAESVTDSEHAQKKINWRRPRRRPHSLDITKSQSIILPELPSPVFLYIQMQLCHEKSLKEWLKDNRVRDFGDVLNIFRQILSAVEYVHLQGLIHRDLKVKAWLLGRSGDNNLISSPAIYFSR